MKTFERKPCQGGRGHRSLKLGGVAPVTDKDHERTMRAISKSIKDGQRIVDKFTKN
jgi:hypothetical protein